MSHPDGTQMSHLMLHDRQHTKLACPTPALEVGLLHYTLLIVILFTCSGLQRKAITI